MCLYTTHWVYGGWGGPFVLCPMNSSGGHESDSENIALRKSKNVSLMAVSAYKKR